MNELLARLTNLSYEVFGVLLPGIVVSLFLLLSWIALGSLAPVWSFHTLPEFTIVGLRNLFDALSLASGIGVSVPLIAIWYFLGHILLWIGRSGPSVHGRGDNWATRVALTLVLRIPKPLHSFDPRLRPLFEAVRKEFASSGVDLEWRHFYPVVKSFLSRELASSLVATYQNKYTFHRSVATASAVLFWISVLTLIGALITFWANGSQPNWLLLIFLLGGSVLIAWGFSGSYMYHWEMFGNTIITEAYSLIYGPKHDDSSDPKPGDH